MFELTEPRQPHAFGTDKSAALTPENAADMRILGGLFRGEIRQLCFAPGGALLVLSGRGVLRLDPDTLAHTGHWLPTHHVQHVHTCGEQLWVVTGDRVYVANFGEELPDPVCEIASQWHHRFSAAGRKLAVVSKRGAIVIDADTRETKQFEFDEAWYEALWHKSEPDRAMLSPSGKYVGVTVGHSGYTVVWDVATGAQKIAREHTESMAILDDTRVIKGEEYQSSLVDFHTDEWHKGKGHPSFGDAVVHGDRVLAADANGGFGLLDAKTLDVVAQLAPLTKRFGRVSGTVCADFNATHVATFAGMDGVLRVTKIGGETREQHDYCGGVEGLSVSTDGKRCGVFREWGDGQLDCVDRQQQTIVLVRDKSGDGLTNAGITGDGKSVVAPLGSILRAREVHVAAFGSSEATNVHKIKSCCHEFVNYGDDCYAISTYTLQGSGYVGLHRAGVKRALAKVKRDKEAPWKLAVGHDGSELMIAWESATEIYDKTKRPKVHTSLPGRAGAVALGPRGYWACVYKGQELTIGLPDSQKCTVELAKRDGHSSPRLAFSRDGGLLFIGASDGVLEVRRTRDGALLHEVQLHSGEFKGLQCCGETLWSIGRDGTLLFVGVPVA